MLKRLHDLGLALGLACGLVFAIAAGHALAIPSPPETVTPVYVRPYVLSRCLTPIRPMDRDTGVVIQDQQTLASRWLNTPDCQTDKTMAIDFNRDVLLGRAFAIPGGCSRGGNGFTLSVTADKRRRLYTHTITHGIGPCAGQSNHEIWVVASKLPTTYRVEFQHIRQPGLLVTCDDENQW